MSRELLALYMRCLCGHRACLDPRAKELESRIAGHLWLDGEWL